MNSNRCFLLSWPCIYSASALLHLSAPVSQIPQYLQHIPPEILHNPFWALAQLGGKLAGVRVPCCQLQLHVDVLPRVTHAPVLAGSPDTIPTRCSRVDSPHDCCRMQPVNHPV